MSEAANKVMTLRDELAELRGLVLKVLDRLEAPAGERSAFTVEEVARMLGKSCYSVREWCRLGRVHATKRAERRGGAELWSISAAEVARIRDEGLLPPATRKAG